MPIANRKVRVVLFCVLTIARSLFAQVTPEATIASANQHSEAGERLRFHHHWKDALKECSQALDLLRPLSDSLQNPAVKSALSQAFVCIGASNGQQGRWESASSALLDALLLDEANPFARNAFGWVLASKTPAEIENATKEFRAALRSKPDYARAHANLSWSLNLQGDTAGAQQEEQAALRFAREAVRSKPKSAEAHLTLADILSSEDKDAAIAEYREALRLDPELGDAHNSIGDILLRKRDFPAAAAEYTAAIGLEPEDSSPYSGLAFALLRQDKVDEARTQAEQAARLRPDRPYGWFLIGQVLERQGDRKGALEYYRRASQADPRNAGMREQYSRLRSEMELLPEGWSTSLVHAVTMAFALVPSILLFIYFRARDLYPEPAKVLWITFGLGVLIIAPVLLIDQPLAFVAGLFHGTFSAPAAEAFFTAALPEELMKFVVVVFYCARHKEFDEPMDGVVYGAVASLGFATFENFLYVSNYGIGTAVIRAVMSVPAHAFMGAAMGYFVGQWRFGPPDRRGSNLVMAYLAPVGLHWIYDFPLMAQSAAWKLEGHAREIAVGQVRPLAGLPILICIVAAVLTIRTVSRMRRQQIQMTRDIAIAAAAAQGAMDVVALINAPSPKSSRLGWLFAVLGAMIALVGAVLSFGVVLVLRQDWATISRMDVFTGSMVGAIPLLLGILLFAAGAKKIHAARRVVVRPAAIAASA